jgi:hypothetical protein
VLLDAEPLEDRRCVRRNGTWLARRELANAAIDADKRRPSPDRTRLYAWHAPSPALPMKRMICAQFTDNYTFVKVFSDRFFRYAA